MYTKQKIETGKRAENNALLNNVETSVHHVSKTGQDTREVERAGQKLN
jgi:hypothetical protein